MKAVNLIPSDIKKSGNPTFKLAPLTYTVLGFLVAGVVLLTLYVLAGNKVNSRQNELTSLQTQVAQAQSEAAQLGSFGTFASLAQTRLQTVRGIAATRFDWHSALSDLSRVIPANASLQSLNATIVPGASAGGTGGGSSGLRGALLGPAFELVGCTHTQDDVARLISRLRVMSGVQRVALGNATKTSNAQMSNGASGTSAATHPRGCPANAPTFNVIVYFQAVAGAGATGATALGSTTTGGAQ